MAKNASLKIGSKTMDYIRFGKGEKVLIIIPGLGDGLKTVKGSALTMSIMYRMFSKDYTVYAFSRINELPDEYSTEQMADDIKDAMDALGISKAHIFGVSMGGMIAQHFAIKYPSMVDKLLLVVTSARPNNVLNSSINEWISLAEKGDHKEFLDSNLRLIYSEKYYKNNRPFIPLISLLTKPKSYKRLYTLSNACLLHDTFDKLGEITAPCLVIGGKQDKALGYEASVELSENIPNAKLHSYADLGHGLYEEAKDFQKVIYDFLK